MPAGAWCLGLGWFACALALLLTLALLLGILYVRLRLPNAGSPIDQRGTAQEKEKDAGFWFSLDNFEVRRCKAHVHTPGLLARTSRASEPEPEPEPEPRPEVMELPSPPWAPVLAMLGNFGLLPANEGSKPTHHFAMRTVITSRAGAGWTSADVRRKLDVRHVPRDPVLHHIPVPIIHIVAKLLCMCALSWSWLHCAGAVALYVLLCNPHGIGSPQGTLEKLGEYHEADKLTRQTSMMKMEEEQLMMKMDMGVDATICSKEGVPHPELGGRVHKMEIDSLGAIQRLTVKMNHLDLLARHSPPSPPSFPQCFPVSRRLFPVLQWLLERASDVWSAHCVLVGLSPTLRVFNNALHDAFAWSQAGAPQLDAVARLLSCEEGPRREFIIETGRLVVRNEAHKTRLTRYQYPEPKYTREKSEATSSTTPGCFQLFAEHARLTALLPKEAGFSLALWGGEGGSRERFTRRRHNY